MDDSLNSCRADAAQAGKASAWEQCSCQVPVDAANKWQPSWTHTDTHTVCGKACPPTLKCLTDAPSFMKLLTFHRPALPQQSEPCTVCLHHHGMLHRSPHVGLAEGGKAALLLILKIQTLQHGQLVGSCRGRRVGTSSTGFSGQMSSYLLIFPSTQGQPGASERLSTVISAEPARTCSTP